MGLPRHISSFAKNTLSWCSWSYPCTKHFIMHNVMNFSLTDSDSLPLTPIRISCDKPTTTDSRCKILESTLKIFVVLASNVNAMTFIWPKKHNWAVIWRFYIKQGFVKSENMCSEHILNIWPEMLNLYQIRVDIFGKSVHDAVFVNAVYSTVQYVGG